MIMVPNQSDIQKKQTFFLNNVLRYSESGSAEDRENLEQLAIIYFNTNQEFLTFDVKVLIEKITSKEPYYVPDKISSMALRILKGMV